MIRWPAGQNPYLVVPSLIFCLLSCWICSLSSQVQILGHTCKIVNWLPLASWGLLNLLCSIWVIYLTINEWAEFLMENYGDR